MLRLGENGWSAVISDEFTFDNVKKLATAIAVYLLNNDQLARPIVVGYDARFLSDKAADIIVKALESAGASILLTDRDVPLPVLEWVAGDRGAACALMVTGGASPPQYSGLKLLAGADLVKKGGLNKIDKNVYYGSVSAQAGGADPDYLSFLSGLNRLKSENIGQSKVERFDPRERYCKFLAAGMDDAAIKKAKLKVVVDPLFGSVRGYLDTLLQRAGCAVEEIHNYRDVLFGGRAPDPAEGNLAELKAKVAEAQADLGLALSGDGGDFAVVKKGGAYLPSSSFAAWKPGGSLPACLRIVERAARNLL